MRPSLSFIPTRKTPLQQNENQSTEQANIRVPFLLIHNNLELQPTSGTAARGPQIHVASTCTYTLFSLNTLPTAGLLLYLHIYGRLLPTSTRIVLHS
uniref:Ovule protein n=1 Tax=Panagrellus redivivus TaxID=6233 RepID=A0A7E4VV22_PANRE